MRSSYAPHRHARTLARVGIVALLAALLQVAGVGPASAATPLGDVNVVESVNPGQVHVGGWAFDPDQPGSWVDIHVYIGVSGTNIGPAKLYRPDVGQVYPAAGDFHGFDASIDVPEFGTLNWEIYAIDSQGGPPALVETGQVTVGDPTPTGAVESATSTTHRTVQVSGWASDPNAPASPVAIEVYVGGSFDTAGVEYHSLTAGTARADGRRGFSGTFTTSRSGPQDLYVYAKNVPGTPGSARLIGVVNVSIFVDTRAPETVITSMPKTATPTDVINVRFAADEPDATFECRWDDLAWFACQTGTTVSFTPGTHTVSVRATDAVGNTDKSPATDTVVVTDYVTQPPTPGPSGPAVRVRSVKKKSRLRIDVDPDSATVNYRVKVQRKVGRKWRTVTKVRTRGAKDVAVVDLRRGKYRVVLPTSAAGAAVTSSSVRLKR